MRVTIKPSVLRWARERARLDLEKLAAKFKKLPEWESGEARPTLKQVESFAKAVHVPVGYLFLPEPPDEALPIPDFRTFADRAVTRPSPNLLDTLYVCQERQSWYRDFVRVAKEQELDFVGSATITTSPEEVAKQMRATLNFDLDVRRACRTWSEALSLFVQQADKVGVLVMISGVVQNNTHRNLDPEEFRGFALADPFAPLIFINGADTKAAQMFTLAHELAHLWLGASALSNISAAPARGFRPEEVWCNAVAAEFLVPLARLHEELRVNETIGDRLSRLARTFKVSTLVILRRLLDANQLSRREFDEVWSREIDRLRELTLKGASGGNFYHTTLARVSRRLAHALVISTLEGHTLYRDAFRMLGVSKTESFNNLGRALGVML